MWTVWDNDRDDWFHFTANEKKDYVIGVWFSKAAIRRKMKGIPRKRYKIVPAAIRVRQLPEGK